MHVVAARLAGGGAAVSLDLGVAGRPASSATHGRRLPKSPLAPVVIAIGTIISLLFAFYESRAPGVYYSQVNVVFTAPPSKSFPNPLIIGTDGLTIAAGVVAKRIGSQSGVALASGSVTLADEGVRRGYSVRLPDDGGQYEHNFDKSLLDVQVVDSSAEAVTATMTRLLGEINADLETIQDDQGVAQVNRIRTALNPPSPPVLLLTGSRTRAVAASLLFGLGATALASWAVVQRNPRPPNAHQGAPAPAASE